MIRAAKPLVTDAAMASRLAVLPLAALLDCLNQAITQHEDEVAQQICH